MALPKGGGFLARRGQDGWEVIPEAPRLDRGATGHPLASLTLVLTRPTAGEADLERLIAGGSLALTCSFAVQTEELKALEAVLAGRCRPYYVRSASSELRGDGKVYARAAPLGIEPRWSLGVSLQAPQAIEALHAFRGTADQTAPMRVTTEIHGPGAPVIGDVPLVDLVGGLLDGADPGRFLQMVAVGRDGRLASLPPPRKSAAGASRAQAGAAQMLAVGGRVQALPFALTSGVAPQVSAAALAASGGASSPAAQIGPNAQVLIAHDAVWHGPIVASDGEEANVPTEHLPMATDAGAPYWLDAIDRSVAFYAPGFEAVAPAASDDPAAASFSFTYGKSGPIVGGGGVQVGLTATIRLTVKQTVPKRVTDALAAAAGLAPKAVPLQKLACALEISYRRAGSAEVVAQRFPCAATREGDRLVATVELLDDWVRLAYAGLAMPPVAGIPAPRLVVDYSFPSYAWIVVGGPILAEEVSLRPEPLVVGGGIHDRIDKVGTLADLPARIERPVLVEETLAVVGPAAVTQFRREAPGRKPRDLAPLRLQAGALGMVRPHLGSIIARRRRLVTRTLVRSEGVALSMPCESVGNFYLERAADGTTTAVGCQDSLKLGETSAKAFREIPELRDPAFRVWRSLQQPGRFLITPAAYRVGRHGAAAGDRAFRPMVALFGLLDPEPAEHRYVLAATLVPDVPPAALARLSERLASHAPARAPRSIVYPTDPFVGADAAFSWAAPASTEPPRTMTVVDAVTATFTMALTEAVLFMAMVNRTGLQGAAAFTLPDGTVFDAALSIDGDVVGPPESGPVVATVSGSKARLKNGTAERMNVTGAVAVAADGKTVWVEAGAALDPGAEIAIDVPAGTVRAFAEARPAERRPIEEMNVFVEDVTAGVTFVNQLHFANHGLAALRVKARLKGDNHVEEADLPEGKTAEITFTLPITAYLERRTLQYSLVETGASGPAKETPWRDWDLDTSSVIGVTADLL